MSDQGGGRLAALGRLPGRLAEKLSLLRRDPEVLARGLLEISNPALFEERLIDVMHARPMHVRFVPGLGARPRLNVLDTAWTQSGMTGGPNTVINLAARVARQGVDVRLVSTIQPNQIDPAWFARHARALAGEGAALELASAVVDGPALEVGPGDGFVATHWTTAQQLKPVLPGLPIRQFFYMLQEFEPAFYAWSSNYARAVETFGLDFWPIINEATLADYLLSQPIGRLSDAETRRRAIVFEPAVDGGLFHPPKEASAGRRRLLFYARPSNTRNLFGLGLLALRAVAADPAFAGWEFLAIGGRGSVPVLELGGGAVLRPAPWVDYAGYGGLLREADVLLCPMMSPHTSYPVLEMAACGGLAVTNCFGPKTEGALAALSDNIVATEATVEGFAAGLLRAARLVADGRARTGSLRMARDWGEALDPAAARIAEVFRGWVGGSASR